MLVMRDQQWKELAVNLLKGKITPDEFATCVMQMSTRDVGEAQIDLDRRRRCGFAEVVFGEGKSVDTLVKIFRELLVDGQEVLATRISAKKAGELVGMFPGACYNKQAGTLRIQPAHEAVSESGEPPRPPTMGRVVLVTAGTSDRAVAEEARETLDWMGVEVELIGDVGVAGPHRLTAHLDKLTAADAIVVVAGMEGALPSVVGGHVACPVIAVPTSVGYGANFGGVAPLLTMLNSCAANVVVVNIDAGFKAGYVAGLIAARAAKKAASSE